MPPTSHQCRKSHAHQNHHDCKTRPDITSLIATREASGRWERVTPVVVSGGGSPTCPQMGQSCWQRQHSTCVLLEFQLLTSQLLCCWTNYFPGMNPLGKLLTPGQLTATTDLPQTTGLLPPHLARGTITLVIRPYFPCPSRSLAQSVARSYTQVICS